MFFVSNRVGDSNLGVATARWGTLSWSRMLPSAPWRDLGTPSERLSCGLAHVPSTSTRRVEPHRVTARRGSVVTCLVLSRAAQTALYASSGTRATRPRFPAPLFPLHCPVAPGPSLISVRPLFSPASGPGIRLRSSFSWNALLILFPESLFPSCPSAQPPLASSRSLPCPVGFSERSALSSFRTPFVPWNRKRKATAVRSRDGRSSRGRQEKQRSDALPRCSLVLLGRLGKGRWPARCRLLVPPIA